MCKKKFDFQVFLFFAIEMSVLSAFWQKENP